MDLKLFQAADIQKTLVITTGKASEKKLEQLHKIGVEVIICEADMQGRLVLPLLWRQLAQSGITALLVEGGGQLITSILKYQLANRFIAVIAPLLLGQGTPAVGNLGNCRIDQAIQLVNLSRKSKGNDLIQTSLSWSCNIFIIDLLCIIGHSQLFRLSIPHPRPFSQREKGESPLPLGEG